MSTGIFNTGLITQDLARKSFAGMITRLFPNGQTPLFGLTSMLSSETALQSEHGFFTKTMLFPQLTVSAAGQLAADTIFTVTSTTNVLPGMLMRVDTTGENILVVSINSTTQVTVQRAVGSTAMDCQTSFFPNFFGFKALGRKPSGRQQLPTFSNSRTLNLQPPPTVSPILYAPQPMTVTFFMSFAFFKC